MNTEPRPGDAPGLRRELVEWCRQYGAPYFHAMIECGRQPIRPAGPAPAVANLLAVAELDRLTRADLWYVDHDLCDLTRTAAPTMPRFAPHPHDLPSRRGLAVFATPLDSRSPAEEEGLVEYAAALGVPAEAVTAATIDTGAVSWGPVELPDRDDCPAGAVWMTFYTWSRLEEILAAYPERRRREALLGQPKLSLDNEAVVRWTPEGGPEAPYLLPEAGTADTTLGLASTVFAAFRLVAQGGLCDTPSERPSRPERRRDQRAGIEPRDVRVARLRPGAGGGSTGTSGREYHHRWVVRGHWRQQPYGPGRESRRPRWIPAHVKGPDGAPLLGGERVTVVDTRSGGEAS